MTQLDAILLIAWRLHNCRDIWTDQKLIDVLVFAVDGKLSFHYSCNCFLGVESSSVLHVRHAPKFICPEPRHYVKHKTSIDGAPEAEEAFLRLAPNDEGRNKKMVTLLQDEIGIRRREQEKSMEQVPGECVPV